ncbi:UNKNOWN [Stylonychia lemnae]|uniref:Uncharacterized protein n=1 Tax=Stylonychia lemnae TaxID=5949 RepID=A0A078A3L0_STYLE|nr:UNKNOWN [Stylonychia lemnae]|eukprot:CDW76113.1 UNKNOWN [Stylonychia lemnae]
MVLALYLKILQQLHGEALSDGTVDSNYGGEKLVSISAGIDGSLWALKQEENVINYQVLKWQTGAQKWYIVPCVRGVSLSVYNEISVAIVDEKGLLSLSSSVGHQDEAQYIGIVTAAATSTAPTQQQTTNIPATTVAPTTTDIPTPTVAPTTTDIPTPTVAPTTNIPPAIVSTSPPQFPEIIGQPADSFVSQNAFKQFAEAVNQAFGKNIKSFTQVFYSKKNQNYRMDAMKSIIFKKNIFGFIKTNTGSILGFYYEGPIYYTSESVGRVNTNTMIYGISSDHFSKKELGDNFVTYFGPFESNTAMQIITTPRARLAFYPSCINYRSGTSNQAQCYSDSNFEQQEYCYWTLLKPENSNADFECEQIEYYQANLQ